MKSKIKFLLFRLSILSAIYYLPCSCLGRAFLEGKLKFFSLVKNSNRIFINKYFKEAAVNLRSVTSYSSISMNIRTQKKVISFTVGCFNKFLLNPVLANKTMKIQTNSSTKTHQSDVDRLIYQWLKYLLNPSSVLTIEHQFIVFHLIIQTSDSFGYDWYRHSS